MKSIDSLDQIRLGIGSSFRKPCLLVLHTLLLPQLSQAPINVRISRDILGQKNQRATIAYIVSLLRWIYVVESWIFQSILALRFSSEDTQIRPRYISLLKGDIPHSLINTFKYRLEGKRYSYSSTTFLILAQVGLSYIAPDQSSSRIGSSPTSSPLSGTSPSRVRLLSDALIAQVRLTIAITTTTPP